MIYIAAPFFTKEQREAVENIVANLEYIGFAHKEIFVPMEHSVPNAWNISNQEWGKAVYEMDMAELDKATIVVALDWGFNSDAGTAWELGYACAKGKKVIHVIMNSESNTLFSVMTCNACSRTVSYNNSCTISYHDFWKTDNNVLAQIEQK